MPRGISMAEGGYYGYRTFKQGVSYIIISPTQILLMIIIIGMHIAPFPFIKCSKALHIVLAY